MKPGALEGIRVLDFTWVLAGPYCTRILADLGADVIKVQSMTTSNGYDARGGGRTNSLNRNKRSLRLNMRKQEGRDIAGRLAQHCDVVIDNFSARVMKSWGLGYEEIAAIKPDIISISMSGFGHDGPWKDYVSYGLTLQALSGVTHLMSYPHAPPQGFGYSYADYGGGLTAAIAVLAALHHRNETGEGQFIDVSQYEAMTALTGMSLLQRSVNGDSFEPKGNLLQARPCGPYGAYRCKDDNSGALTLPDRWLAIGVTNDQQWEAFVSALGGPAWASDPRFANQELRYENASALDAYVGSWTRGLDCYEAMRVLTSAGVPAGVVQNTADLVHKDDQIDHFGFWWFDDDLPTPSKRLDGFPVQMSQTPAKLARLGPDMGQDDEDVLSSLLGFTSEEVERLRELEIVW